MYIDIQCFDLLQDENKYDQQINIRSHQNDKR